jgi:hypothetical protein
MGRFSRGFASRLNVYELRQFLRRASRLFAATPIQSIFLEAPRGVSLLPVGQPFARLVVLGRPSRMCSTLLTHPTSADCVSCI